MIISSSRDVLLSQYHRALFPTAKDHGWRHLDLPQFADLHQGVVDSAYAVLTSDRSNVSVSIAKRTAKTLNSFAPATHKLHLLHEAFWRHELVISVRTGATVTDPIIIKHKDATNGAVLPKVTVSLQTGACAKVIEIFSHRNRGTVSSQTKVQLGPRSELEFICDMATRPEVNQFHRHSCQLESDAKLDHHNIAYGNGFLRHETSMFLNGRNAAAAIGGLSLGYGRAQHVFDSLQQHQTTHSTSDLEYRTITADQARMIYHGMIHIAKGGKGSNAYQKNANILLSSMARAYSTPNLEIEANDVRCTHGSTSGPLDQNSLFYLQSRGLNEKASRELLLQGFAVGFGSFIDQKMRRYHNRIANRELKKIVQHVTT